MIAIYSVYRIALQVVRTADRTPVVGPPQVQAQLGVLDCAGRPATGADGLLEPV